jgi:hypothetical protein
MLTMANCEHLMGVPLYLYYSSYNVNNLCIKLSPFQFEKCTKKVDIETNFTNILRPLIFFLSKF